MLEGIAFARPFSLPEDSAADSADACFPDSCGVRTARQGWRGKIGGVLGAPYFLLLFIYAVMLNFC